MGRIGLSGSAADSCLGLFALSRSAAPRTRQRNAEKTDGTDKKMRINATEKRKRGAKNAFHENCLQWRNGADGNDTIEAEGSDGFLFRLFGRASGERV